MELIWNELDAERLFERRTVQVRVEGDMPSPDSRSIAQIVSCAGRVFLTGAAADADEIRLEGRIDVTVAALDRDGEPFGFESGANFRHTVSMPGALRGMSVQASPCVQSLRALPKGVSAGLEASVDIDLRVVSGVPMRVTGGVRGVNDLELKTKPAAFRRRRTIGCETLRLREELSAEGVKEIVSCEGLVSIRDVTVESGAATVSGQVSVSATAPDASGHLGQLVRSVPFRERIAVDAPAEEAFCTAELKSLYLRSLGEDFGIAAMEAEIAFTVWKLEEVSISVPADAFSPSIGFGCLKERVKLSDHLGQRSARLVLQEKLPLPEGAADISRPVCASAIPVICEAPAEGGAIGISGVLVTSAAYESPAGVLSAFSADVPFSADIEAPAGAGSAMVTAACLCGIKASGERELTAEYSLELCAECFREEELDALVGLAEGERPEAAHGIAVCFASEGEDAFDIAKRFSVPCAEVRKLNPDIAEPFREGDKLIILS